MVLKLRLTLGLALFQASTARRARDPAGMRALGSGDDVTICGDPDIWADITSPDSIYGVRGIEWSKIDGTMENYVDIHKDLVASSDQTINKLKKKIEEKNAKASSRPISEDEIQDLVEKSVAHSTSFGSSEIAKVTACGKPGKKFNGKRPNPRGFGKSKEIMMEVAEEFFTPDVESDVGRFTTVCEDYLGFQRTGDTKKDDIESYCDELCADLAKNAQAVSDRKGDGSKADVRKLQRELQKNEVQREELYSKQTQCEHATTSINSFRKYLEELAQDMSDKHEIFQDAEWALADATDIWNELTGKLLEQQATMEDAKKGLTDLGKAAQAASEALDTADAQKQSASGALKTAEEQWKTLTADLEGVRAAEKYADDVKKRLSLLLLKMDGYVEECVREPVRNIGLSEETKVYEGQFFTWDVETLPAKEDMDAALSAFHDYCENTAKGIFEKVKDTVDLSPLCELQPQDVTLNEIVTTIQDRKNSVVEAITSVQSWLDPFKGTDVTKETEKPDFVDHGEPLGLRRVMNMGLEEFYSGYLKKWKKHGEFLQLLASLTVAISDLDKKVASATDAMEKAAGEMKAAQDQLESAVATFKQAEDAATLEKQELVDLVNTLEQQVSEAKQNLEDLEKKVQEAKKAWKISSETLLTQHAKASAFAEKPAAISELK